MNAENKVCQNCKKDFVIEPEDFDFYEKMKVPAPTWCPECRRQRRLLFRNERTLYRRKCSLCAKDMISMYPQETVFPVYCHECWYSDKWDGVDFGREYDFSRQFFKQMAELWNAVPRMNLFQRNSIDCEFTNMVGESKNVYLSYSVVERSENVFYSKFVDKSFNIFDSYGATNSDHCYENISVDRNYSSSFAILSRNCIDCHFIFDCINCKNCVLSSNLRNKQYFIRNKTYTKDDYFREIEKITFGSRKQSDQYFKELLSIKEKSLHKYADIIKAPGSTGNHIANAKNVKNCFETHDVEDVKNCYRVLGASDFLDVDYAGLNSEMFYEYVTGGKSGFNVKFSIAAFDAVRESEYTDYCSSCAHCFGCAGLKNKEFCILNKKYSKEDYEIMVGKIKKQMDELPYTDKTGKTYKYGEFFPAEISYFSYNESLAQEIFPLTKQTAFDTGFKWRDPETKKYIATKTSSGLPDNIAEVSDSISSEIISCLHDGKCNHSCSGAYKIVPEELQFYKKMNLPIPILCPNCRFYERIKLVDPLKLWHRQCMCGSTSSPQAIKNTAKHFHGDKPCPNEFETSYAPDRPEIVYCEQCYNAEVA
ncbi:MAG: hypothetical protein NT155_04605 [Candidatus Staskawiczbacteria bacterium]|nr:hypothetical protein [Candidatus Staskawiczbacteria bacterium]